MVEGDEEGFAVFDLIELARTTGDADAPFVGSEGGAFDGFVVTDGRDRNLDVHLFVWRLCFEGKGISGGVGRSICQAEPHVCIEGETADNQARFLS